MSVTYPNRCVLFALLLLCLVAGKSSGQMTFPQPETTTDHGWEMCLPENEGVDSAKATKARKSESAPT